MALHSVAIQQKGSDMNKKLMLTLALAATAGLVMARPGPGGFHGGHYGGRGHHGGYHRGGWGYHHGGYRHHHCGWGWGLGAAGVAIGTAAAVRSLTSPTVIYSGATYPAYSYPVAPAVYPAATVVAPAPVVYPTYAPGVYRTW